MSGWYHPQFGWAGIPVIICSRKPHDMIMREEARKCQPDTIQRPQPLPNTEDWCRGCVHVRPSGHTRTPRCPK